MLLWTSVEVQHQNISESILLATGTETEEYYEPLDIGMFCLKKKRYPITSWKTFHTFSLLIAEKKNLIYIIVTNSKGSQVENFTFFIAL